jgi:hypothetical protein
MNLFEISVKIVKINSAKYPQQQQKFREVELK